MGKRLWRLLDAVVFAVIVTAFQLDWVPKATGQGIVDRNQIKSKLMLLCHGICGSRCSRQKFFEHNCARDAGMAHGTCNSNVAAQSLGSCDLSSHRAAPTHSNCDNAAHVA